MAKNINKPEEIILNKNDEVQEILGSPPSWILRWGITLFVISTAILLTISWVIKYPDVIPAEVELTTQNPPIRVFARSNGKVDLLVKNKQQVKVGETLAILESTAQRKDITQLKSFLNTINQRQNIGKFQKLDLPRNLQLGTLQASYANFIQKYKDYRYFVKQKSASKKVLTLQKQIHQLQQLNINLNLQQRTLIQELAITKKALQRRTALRKDLTISAERLEEAQANVLQYQRQLDRISADTISNSLRIEQIQLQMIELKQGDGDSKATKSLLLQEDVQKMKSKIEQWEQSYLIIAPISGQVAFAKTWSSNQYINANQEVMTIVPNLDNNILISKAFLPPIGSGKVKKGMTVNIRLADYPYQEFGMLVAKVKSISLVPQEGLYQVEIEMPQKLVTTYDKEITFQQEMKGVANIITEDRRILVRIFDKVISAIKNR